MGGRARNLVFPPARIKRMMRSDKDVGKIAVSAPFLLSKALQLALEDFLTTAAELARQRSLSVITPDQLRHCVENEKRFKSLHRVVEHVPLTCNQVEETKKLSKGRNRNRKENNEEFFESKRKKASKQSNVVTNQVVEQQTESMVMEHAGDTEQYANTASQSRQVENKDVSDTAPAEGLSVKVSLQSTAIEDNYDEE
ncbi:Dr1-associated corepressor [Galdieria sulphuraria]|nr:Dr1-associated corepressor [Galdieria sulphuraria]